MDQPRLPREGVDVVLGGNVWHLRESSRISDFGVTDTERQEIVIRSGLGDEEWVQTVLHEGLHALCPNHDEDWVTRGEMELYVLLLETIPALRETIRASKN